MNIAQIKSENLLEVNTDSKLGSKKRINTVDKQWRNMSVVGGVASYINIGNNSNECIFQSTFQLKKQSPKVFYKKKF